MNNYFHRLLAARAGRSKISPGERLGLPMDRVALDGNGADLVLDARATSAPLGDRLVLVDGPRLPRKLRARLRRSATGLGATINLDPQRPGFPEAVLVHEGLLGGGMFVAGLDASLGAVGGLGSLALKVSPDEIHKLLHERKLSIQVPKVAQVLLSGREPRSVTSTEVSFALAESARAAGLQAGTVLELRGDWIDAQSVASRMALCGHMARLGFTAIVAPDRATEVFLAARRGAGGSAMPAAAPETPDVPDLELNVAKVALQCQSDFPNGERIVLSGDRYGPEVDEVVLAGDIEELRTAARILGERRLHPGLLLCVVPSDRRTLMHALEEGLVGTLLRAGAQLLPPGQLPSPLRRGERRVVTRPTGTGDLLCGPAVAAVAAVLGMPADPEFMRRETQRSSTPT